MAGLKHPVTLDGRYFVVRGKLLGTSNPDLNAEDGAAHYLMAARRAVKDAKSFGDQSAGAEAHGSSTVQEKPGEPCGRCRGSKS
jgi:hypothetical protein